MGIILSFAGVFCFCLSIILIRYIHIIVSQISQSLVIVVDLETLFTFFLNMSELAFVLLVSLTVPGRPLLDMLDGFLESKDTVEDS